MNWKDILKKDDNRKIYIPKHGRPKLHGPKKTGRPKLHGPVREKTARHRGWKRKTGRPKLHGPVGSSGKLRGRPPSPPRKKVKPINSIIIDYFTMYKNKYNREPTLEEIKNEEGRILTSDEEDSYYRYKNR